MPDFKCACGCELQLSRGDALDAMLVLARLGGAPRTWGVDISPSRASKLSRIDPPEPQEGRPCSKCGDMVYVPVYAAKLLDERKGMWPFCGDCQKPKKQSEQMQLTANQYW